MTDNTSRRALLGALPVIAASTIPAKAGPAADSRLVALVARHAEFVREYRQAKWSDEVANEVLNNADPVAEAIAVWPAASWADIVAKARFATTVLPHFYGAWLLSDETEAALVRGIVTDLLRLNGETA